MLLKPSPVDQQTIGQLLAASGLPALEARALLAHQLGIAREGLIARPDQRVTNDDATRFIEVAQRRQRGEPLAYLVGEREFYGRTFAVTPAVLIPRPETELLVDTALRRGPQGAARVLDLGTGSGCIAITLALERPEWHLVATDVSSDALAVARANAERLQAANVAFCQGNWFDAIGDTDRFDVIVANPPYVPPGDPHLDALAHEPRQALIADDNGFAYLRVIIDGAPSHLLPAGVLALEHSYEQGAGTRALFAGPGWRDVHTLFDLAELERVTVARTAV